MNAWAERHIEMLKNGDTITFERAGRRFTLKPVRGPGDATVGNAVLAEAAGEHVLAVITTDEAVDDRGKRRYRVDGHWVPAGSIYGVVVDVEG